MPTTNALSGGVQSDFARSYNSMSGSDIRAQIGPISFAELQAISYNVTREKAPIYVMGTADPVSYSRNKRGIAGSLVWINFDRHALLDAFRKVQATFVANKDDVRPAFATETSLYASDTAIFSSTPSRENNVPIGATIDQARQSVTSVSGFKDLAYAWYSDQVPPFDITLIGNNELGAATAAKILGVEILNEGMGISVDDAVTEMQATFVARLVEPMQAVQTPFLNSQFFQG
jgi:hypothetical protein